MYVYMIICTYVRTYDLFHFFPATLSVTQILRVLNMNFGVYQEPRRYHCSVSPWINLWVCVFVCVRVV